ncbi:hypothetical protein IAU59_005787 [Kwoniella sp. CBS 9459]
MSKIASDNLRTLSGGSASSANKDKALPQKPELLTPSPVKVSKDRFSPASPKKSLSPSSGMGYSSADTKESRGGERQKSDGRKSSLNPHSSSFNPIVGSPEVPFDFSHLAIGDEANSSNQMPGEGPVTPKKKKEAWNFETPRRSTRKHESSSPTPEMSYTPYTPGSGASTQPVTPYTPSHMLPFAYGDAKEDEQYKNSNSGFAAAQETAENIGRYLLISNIPKDASDIQVRNMIQSIADFKALIVKHIKTKGCVIAVFFDPRQTLALYQRLRTGAVTVSADGSPTQLHCMKVEKNVVQSILGRTEGWDQISSTSEAVIKVQIEDGVGVSTDAMTRCLSSIGEVQRLNSVGHEGRVFIAEFWDTRDAASAITLLNGQKAGYARLHVSYLYATANYPTAHSSSGFTLASAAYTPGALAGNISRDNLSTASSDVFGHTGSTTEGGLFSQLNTPASSIFRRVRSEQDVFGSRPPSSVFSPNRQSMASSNRYSSPSSWDRNSIVGSQSGYETSSQMLALSRRLDEPGTVEGLANSADIEARARQQQGLGGHWSLNDRKAIPAHNRVFPERILSGLDSRTTVMVKDVPNKLSRQELVDILQKAVPGEYDFVYLRFDFKNCCNFIQAKVGKKWNLFSSEKVLQVSYADIQGKAALINKFRNSAVMGVIEPWRPQIFYSSGSMKGMPEPFPDSDNLAVRQRSTAAQLSGFDSASSYGYKDDYYYDYASSPVEAYHGI